MTQKRNFEFPFVGCKKMGSPSFVDNPSKKNRCIKWFNNSPSLAQSMPERERKLDTSLEPPLPG